MIIALVMVWNQLKKGRMEMKKFNFDWRSMVLGMALCLVLVVVLGSKAPAPQTMDSTRQVNQAHARVLDSQKQVTLSTVYDKIVQLEAKLMVIEEHCKTIEKKQDDAYHELYYRLPK
jgi:predicted ABC-type exoprotein transport system permease subunit